MATGGDERKNQTSGAVWDRLNQQSDLIGELARNQAALEANVAALAESVRTGFDAINASLNRVVEKDSRPTNWFGAIAALAVVAGGILTFNALQTDPVRIRAIENTGQVGRLHERDLDYAYEHGRMQAQIEELQRHVENIDNQGSRRWNDSPRQ